MIVKSHMIDAPVVARPGDSLRLTHQRMREHDIHHLPVVDERERVIGIISEHDIVVPHYLERSRDGGSFAFDDSLTVADAMTTDPVALHTDDSLKVALDRFLAHSFNALPVLDSDERLVGMLTTKDLLLLLRDQL